MPAATTAPVIFTEGLFMLSLQLLAGESAVSQSHQRHRSGYSSRGRGQGYSYFPPTTSQ